jgi:hypothetical protein
MGKDYRMGWGWRNGMWMIYWAEDGRGRGRQNGGEDDGIGDGMGKDYRMGWGWRNGMWMIYWAEDGRGRGRQNGERRTEWVDDGMEGVWQNGGRMTEWVDDGMEGGWQNGEEEGMNDGMLLEEEWERGARGIYPIDSW